MNDLLLHNLRKVKVACFDFDGVFTDNKVYVTQDGVESVVCFRSDGIGLSNLKKNKIKTFIISSEKNEVVSRRATKLNIDCIKGVENKAEEVKKISTRLNIPLSEFLFIGNDVNDIPALKIVGFPIGVADAYPEIDEFILFRTKTKGGCGAVREICDFILKARILI